MTTGSTAQIIAFADRAAPLDACIAQAQREVEGDDPWLASEATDFLTRETTRARLRQMAGERAGISEAG